MATTARKAKQATRRKGAESSLRVWELIDLRMPLMLLLGAALVIGLMEVGRWLMSPTTLPIASVEIEGDFHQVSATQLQQALAQVELGGFFSVDVRAVREVTEALPWVAAVNVQRRWPDVLHLSFVERKAAARWGESALLSDQGIIFQPATVVEEALPTFVGPQNLAATMLEQYAEIRHLLSALGLSVEHIEVDARRSWLLRLNNGIQLNLGRHDLYARLMRFVKVYDKAIEPVEQRVAWVDMRYTNGFAVQWKSEGAAQRG